MRRVYCHEVSMSKRGVCGFIKPLDFIAAAGVLLAAVLAALPVVFAGPQDNAVILYEDAELTVPLDEPREYRIESNGYTLIVEVVDGGISVSSSDCPDKICTDAPPLRRAGMSIVCLPARVVIFIEGDGDADAIAG